MKRTAMLGAGSMLVAAGLMTFPAAAQSQDAEDQSQDAEEKKVLLVEEHFTGAAVLDSTFEALGTACLTGAVEAGPAFGPCTDRAEGPVPEAGEEPGYLQLTDAGLSRRGGLVYNEPLESDGGIEVTFAQYQYGGTGADGISFFIVDGETDLNDVGAWGGSLGYAQYEDEPGVEGAYLGLGLDAWGNFSADTEGRGNGCPEDQRAPDHLRVAGDRAPDTVALRGPGSGTEGYCLIATTATDEPIGTSADGDTLYGTTLAEPLNTAAIDDAKRLVKMKITDDPEPEVTVDIDYLDGSGWHRVLEATMPVAAPETFKFGFASSTGAATDVHLLRHLRVETFE